MGYKYTISLIVIFVFFLFSFLSAADLSGPDIPYGQQREDLLATAYKGNEKMVYDISWTGGFKIGELHLEIKKSEKMEKVYEIHALVTTDNGLFKYIYPVKDTHITWVYGPKRLPIRYEVWQKEGWNYEAHRLTRYKQKKKRVLYWKNKEPRVVYTIAGYVHNEFSSFFSTRVMDLQIDKPFIVPTFADHKRNEVVVEVIAKTKLADTVLGTVDTVEVMPIMKFEGLYDKRGDTVIWFTDDECRVPVKINSKIILGSLTSELVAWENPDCGKYKKVERKKR